jgi:Fe2+ or Zn2+ uptake regulation protein
MKASSIRQLTISHNPNENALRRSQKLGAAGLRPTRARLVLCSLLFTGKHQHFTAEMLFDEARQAGTSISLGTIYTALREFSEAGLLRHLKLDGGRSYYDTDVAHHQHFCDRSSPTEKHYGSETSESSIVLGANFVHLMGSECERF